MVVCKSTTTTTTTTTTTHDNDHINDSNHYYYINNDDNINTNSVIQKLYVALGFLDDPMSEKIVRSPALPS